jgi:hypothetical protein
VSKTDIRPPWQPASHDRPKGVRSGRRMARYYPAGAV